METSQALRLLEDRHEASHWLRTLGVSDIKRAWELLRSVAKCGVPIDLMSVLCGQLEEDLRGVGKPDLGLTNTLQLVQATRSPMAFVSLLERDREALPTLLQIVASSQRLADSLIQDPESFDLLRLTDGQPVAREVLVKEIMTDIEPIVSNEREAMRMMRQFRHRETLRIAFGDLVRRLPVDACARQSSYLADAVCAAALRVAWVKLAGSRGVPRSSAGQPSRLVVLGFGRYGGLELDYSDTIQIAFIYEAEGKTDGERPVSNREFYERLAAEVVRLLAGDPASGPAYDASLSQRPGGADGPVAISAQDALHYYDVAGRTWERQALVKARVAAGDDAFGRSFIERLQPWVYRRYLSAAEIAEIRSLKRRIEQRQSGEPLAADVLDRDGTVDIEFVIQFLQLLNGAELPDARTTNTVQAIRALEESGCLTMQERSILEHNYEFARMIKHRTQIIANGHQGGASSEPAVEQLAAQMQCDSVAEFAEQCQANLDESRKILNHLLHDAFGEEGTVEPETDLVLDPEPSEETIDHVLRRYNFNDVPAAYRAFMALATEQIPFLSPRRCRHFLASIAPRLLAAISRTPDPDATITSLSRVSDSIGGKAVLWELFSFNPPTLDLYVRLCASSPYLSDILTSHPGMIDELMDSLMLETLPSRDSLERTLDDLCQGAEDVSLILHSFKNANHLRVGVRGILHKDDIKESHRALSDVAEVCLRKITEREFEKLARKLGTPMQAGHDAERRCEFMVIALGKMGGREPNYHSDVDVIFLYETEGKTSSATGQATSNQHFFNELGKRILQSMNQLGPTGKLYDMDRQIRPTGEHGPLAVSLKHFASYLREEAEIWERQALCKARLLYGAEHVQAQVAQALHNAICEVPLSRDDVTAMYRQRLQFESSASARNLKRASGGTMDIEFAVQMLQLRNACGFPEVLQPGTLDAIEALAGANCLSQENRQFFSESYRYLRSVEAGLRLMNTSARHDLPSDETELDKLAYLLGDASGQSVATRIADYAAENRKRFIELFAEREVVPG